MASELTVCLALSHMGLNTTETVGDNSGFLFGVRIVEVRPNLTPCMRERCDEANPTTAAASTSTPANRSGSRKGSIVAEIDHKRRPPPDTCP